MTRVADQGVEVSGPAGWNAVGEGVSLAGSEGGLGGALGGGLEGGLEGGAEGGGVGLAVLTWQWFVVRTRSRQEKALAAELGQRGIRHYLPLVREVKFYNGRRATVQSPLIPGYVFLYGTMEDAYLADRSSRAAQLVKVTDQAKLAWELKNLKAAVEQGGKLSRHPRLVKGARVVVKAGPMKGVRGIVDEVNGVRLVLQISALGQAVSLEIDGGLLEVA